MKTRPYFLTFWKTGEADRGWGRNRQRQKDSGIFKQKEAYPNPTKPTQPKRAHKGPPNKNPKKENSLGGAQKKKN